MTLSTDYDWVIRLSADGDSPKHFIQLNKLVDRIGGNGSKITMGSEIAGISSVDPSATDMLDISWDYIIQAIALKRAEFEVPANYEIAASWETYGDEVVTPMLGDIMIQGDIVMMYIGQDATHYHCLGIVSNTPPVDITRIAQTGSWVYRRPVYPDGLPINVQAYTVTNDGLLVS